MNRSFKLLSGLLLVLGVARLGIAGGPTFDLSVDVPSSVSGAEGAAVEIPGTVLLTTGGLDAAEPGVQGWSVSIVADGWTISSCTTAGTLGDLEANGGLRVDGSSFEITELTTGKGNEGCVSAAVLSFETDVTLPTDMPAPILALTLSGNAPGTAGESTVCTVSFADGLVGSGRPVDNKVTYNGLTQFPSLTSGETTVTAACDETARIRVGFASEVIQPAPHFSTNLGEGIVSEISVGASRTVYVNIVANLAEGEGVQGWSFSIPVDGNALPVSATTDGTIAANEPEGLRLALSFELTEVVNPDNVDKKGNCLNCGQNGVVSAVVFALVEEVQTDPVGTMTALCIDLENSSGEDTNGRVRCADGLIGGGQPVENLFTVAGKSVRFCDCQEVALVPLQVAEFIRGDGNNDGNVNVADAVWIYQNLFRGGDSSGCLAAMNADGRCNCVDTKGTLDCQCVDLQDVLYIINWQFSTSTPMPPPPAPWPDCGPGPDVLDQNDISMADPLWNESDCPGGSTTCS